ncbi:hypothetical protein ABW21_db0202608 [Orbilia brochopaga]|nr:hypothetical protein ABW21_db0202608 [Drechslerella brochopaga]
MQISRISSFTGIIATIIWLAQSNPLPVSHEIAERAPGDRQYCLVFDEWYGSTSSGYPTAGAPSEKRLGSTEDATRCKVICDGQTPSSATESTCKYFNYYIENDIRKCVLYSNELLDFTSAYNSPLRRGSNKYPSSGYQVLSATNTRDISGWTYNCLGSKIWKTFTDQSIKLALPEGAAPTTIAECQAACDTFTANAKAAGDAAHPAVSICNYFNFYHEYTLAYNKNQVTAYHCDLYLKDPANGGASTGTYGDANTVDHWYGESIGYKHTTYENVGAAATWEGGSDGMKWYSSTAAEQHEFADTTP